MINRKIFEQELGGKKITLEVSSIAEQANAAVMAKCGETVVFEFDGGSPDQTFVGKNRPQFIDFQRVIATTGTEGMAEGQAAAVTERRLKRRDRVLAFATDQRTPVATSEATLREHQVQDAIPCPLECRTGGTGMNH